MGIRHRCGSDCSTDKNRLEQTIIHVQFSLTTGKSLAARQERIDAFSHDGAPPAGEPLELLCEHHVGTYVIPFLCRWRNGAWRSLDTDERIEATVFGWRVRGRNQC